MSKDNQNHSSHDETLEQSTAASQSPESADPTDVAGSGNIAAAIAEANDLREKLVRWQADFENLRRRSAREVLEARQAAEGDFARDLLDVLDHFESALSVDPAKTDVASLLQGIKITYDELVKVLGRKGIESYEPSGQAFDPHRHEAVAREDRSDIPAGQVIQTFQRGYKLRDRILRPAKVKVSAKPA